MTTKKHLLGNNTTVGERWVIDAVIDAIKNNQAKLPREIDDLFTLTKAPENAAVEYVLNWKDDE